MYILKVNKKMSLILKKTIKHWFKLFQTKLCQINYINVCIIMHILYV